MNGILTVVTLCYIIGTSILILLKHRHWRPIVLNGLLLCASIAALWIGTRTQAFWTQLACNLTIGASLLFSVVHSYNKLVAPAKHYDTVGENQKPRPFGNGYWR